MFRQEKARQLENKSHVRGVLSKEYYGAEEQQRERKRRQLKQVLDRQVQERRRIKERQLEEQQRKLKKEEQDINMYYKTLASREKPQPTIPKNQGNGQPNFISLMKDAPEKNLANSKVRKEAQSDRKSVQYEKILEEIPVMAADEEGTYDLPQQEIPVLDINDDTRRRKKTKGNRQSRRKETQSRLDTLNSRKNTESGIKQLEVQQQNRKLKEQLKKSQQAISLMMNVLRGNPKFDKYRIQAERILQADQNDKTVRDMGKEGRKSDSNRYFPTLSFNNHKSVLKEYMIDAAKMARKTGGSTRILGPF